MSPQDTRSESLREHTQRTGEDLQGVAAEAGARVRDEAQERMHAAASRQRQLWSHEVKTFANAMRAAGDQFERDEAAGMARQTHGVADSLDDFASDIQERDSRDAFHAVNDFARRQPAALVGASVLAGFFLARFLKSSAEEGDGGDYGEAGGLPERRSAAGEWPERRAETAASPSHPGGPAAAVAPTSSVGPVRGEGRPATDPTATPEPGKPEPGRTV
jgi:hypothetical protein